MLPPSHRNLRLPELHPALEPYRAQLEAVAKPAWLLNAHRVEVTSPTETQFDSVSPFVPAEQGWPLCSHCGDPLSLVCQVNFGQFSGSGMFTKKGLFQFFYCWNCFPPYSEEISPNVFEEGYPGYIPMELLEKQLGIAFRWYADFDEATAATVPQAESPFKGAIVGADAISPVPYLSVPDRVDEADPLADVDFEESNPDDYEWDIRDSVLPTKECISQLGGYPVWVQNYDTPLCPACGNRSELVVAVGSGDTGLIWGDTGYWYVFACKATPKCKGLEYPLMLGQSM